MFDPVTTKLISDAPPLNSLDLETLPQTFTHAFAEIVATRIRLRDSASLDMAERSADLVKILNQMRRLAAAQELLVATSPNRSDRAAAAFVAGTAHQLCLMAETIGEDNKPRIPYINANSVAPEICCTLLFLIADSQSDAAEMAKYLAKNIDDQSAEMHLIKAIGDLATGRLSQIINSKGKIIYSEPVDQSGLGLAVDALLKHLHHGIFLLASELLTNSNNKTEESLSKRVFIEVIDLCMEPIDGVFDVDGANSYSIFPGPLHIAKLLLAISGDLDNATICRVQAPVGVDEEQWWSFIHRTALRRPYLWRNHRAAIEEGYLECGVSAAISFPTGGGKSTLAELKIAVTLFRGHKAVVLAPTLALVDQTASVLQNTFRGTDVLGDLDDEIVFSSAVEFPEVIVTTPERCLMLQSLQPDAFKDVGLIMFDECHLLHPRDSDRSRRSIDSMLCILNLTQLAPEADLLLISAMMKNAEEIAGWIAELTGRRCLALDLAWKPTRQARGCVAYSSEQITELEMLLQQGLKTCNTKNVPAKIKSQLVAYPQAFFCLRQTWATRTRSDYALMDLLDQPVALGTGVRAEPKKWYLTPNANQVAGAIAAAAASVGLKTLIFVQSTVMAESSVSHFQKLIPNIRVVLTKEEHAFRKVVEEELGGPQYCYLQLDDSGCVVGSASSHHAQLLKPERLLHESLFKRRDGIKVLFATSTLAQGMNLPSDIVLIAGDSRWDVDGDSMKQLDAHELLNAAGRAGRAGEGGQGFVLVIPSKVISFDDKQNNITKHWMTLQGIFAQSDQCLEIDDPLSSILDYIHDGLYEGNQDYFLARLPIGDNDTTDGPAKLMINRSFIAYRMRKENRYEWIDSRINSAIGRRAALVPKQEITWLERIASSTGLPYEIIASLTSFLETEKFEGDSYQCMEKLFNWIYTRPEWLLQLIRPNDIEGLFGKSYRSLNSDIDRANMALPVIKTLLKTWMDGKPLCELERAIGTPENKIKTCETARHFAVRLTADLAFLAGLPARIIAAKAAILCEEPLVKTTLITLSGAVRKGCSSPEILANAVLLKSYSRPAARAKFEQILPYLVSGGQFDSFESIQVRVRHAHDIALFSNL
ncbi:DEAD/DEAH box helicase [Aeromonas sp. FDAARGOS 1405]|uniref:DEAD/DEAH box helicase n=1 Tax=unclassified Aeromonas TaxID=257493 RepID=UPI001C21C370|nr:DEAD/DEAH box helicase [Aeromonas sp. FDAARGOS 1405]QXB30910.1 DEAD/DEAH box helicase [Aeromonas sp. FDAARGOS 1405]